MRELLNAIFYTLGVAIIAGVVVGIMLAMIAEKIGG